MAYIALNCTTCDIIFNREKKYVDYSKKNGQINFFCTRQCQFKFQKNGIEKYCIYCNKRYYVTASLVAQQKFCSQNCSAKNNNAKRNETGYSTKNKITERTCVKCKYTRSFSIHAAQSSLCQKCNSEIVLEKQIEAALSKLKNQEIPHFRKKIKLKEKVKYIKIHSQTTKNCQNCSIPFISKCAKFCDNCRTLMLHNNGLKSIQIQGDTRRSKNEIHFAKLCTEKFKNVLTNAPIFNGWDADIVIDDYKIAVSWNGQWHYVPIISENYLNKIQLRDRFRNENIIKCGYKHYSVKDMGKENPVFVEQEFQKFLKWIEYNDSKNSASR